MVGKQKKCPMVLLGWFLLLFGKAADGGKGFLMAEQGLKPEDAAVSDGAQRCPGNDGSIYPCQYGNHEEGTP